MINIEKHKLILVQILKDIYSSFDISSLLGFKGGTALYLFYSLSRFSTDLDFNLINAAKKDFVSKKIITILEKYGELKDIKEKRFTLFFLLSYGPKERNIKVEISTRKFPDKYEIKNYLGIPMLLMKKEDMFAHKLAALLDRKNFANRDIFDIWFCMKERWAINRELLELRTNQNIVKYLDNCIDRIKKVNNTHILQGMGDIINSKIKNQLKSSLKKDVLFLIEFYKKNPIVI